jgi:hypothetical protein
VLSPALVLFFRLLHIIAGAFWFGGVAVSARFIFPSAFALGPAAAPFMDQLGRVRKLPMTLLGSGVTTVATGFVLYWHDSAGAAGTWGTSPMGRTLGAGALFSLVALAIGITVNIPTVKKINALSTAIQAQGGPATAEQQAAMKGMQTKLLTAIRITTMLLLIATAAMAIARYVS